MKKFLISFFILLIIGGTIFFFGWAQFFVSQGSSAVLVSKTGGVHQTVITNGSFGWFWELLLPTNAKLYVFSCAPVNHSVTVSGTLPSAELYKKTAVLSPDFSYEYTVLITLSLKTECLPAFVEKTDITNTEDAFEWLKKEAESIAHDCVNYAIQSAKTHQTAQAIQTAEFTDAIDSFTKHPFVSIDSIRLTAKKEVDFAVYESARQAYALLAKDSEAHLIEENTKEAEREKAEEALFARYRKIGALLKEYPVLLEYFAVTGEPVSAKAAQTTDVVKNFDSLNALKTYQNGSGAHTTAPNTPAASGAHKSGTAQSAPSATQGGNASNAPNGAQTAPNTAGAPNGAPTVNAPDASSTKNASNGGTL